MPSHNPVVVIVAVALLVAAPLAAQETTGDLMLPEMETTPGTTAPVQQDGQAGTMAPATEAATTAVPVSRDFTDGLSTYNQADYPTAVSKFEAVIRENPDQTEAYFYLGYALYKLKRFEESRIAFTEAYKRQSDYLPPVADTAPPTHSK